MQTAFTVRYASRLIGALAKFDPDQVRDASGKFAPAGGGAGGAATAAPSPKGPDAGWSPKENRAPTFEESLKLHNNGPVEEANLKAAIQARPLIDQLKLNVVEPWRLPRIAEALKTEQPAKIDNRIVPTPKEAVEASKALHTQEEKFKPSDLKRFNRFARETTRDFDAAVASGKSEEEAEDVSRVKEIARGIKLLNGMNDAGQVYRFALEAEDQNYGSVAALAFNRAALLHSAGGKVKKDREDEEDDDRGDGFDDDVDPETLTERFNAARERLLARVGVKKPFKGMRTAPARKK
jgi:hypothetical protein